MYHLIFHSRKHQPSAYYYRQPKVNRASTHNQFELDTIRGSIKSRWELHGFGNEDFQKAIWIMEERMDIKAPPLHLHKNMNGHIITVENSADAIWFRLNHENVSKNKCKLIEMYKDLDIEFIRSEYKRFDAAYQELTARTSLGSTLNQSVYNLQKFATHSIIENTHQLNSDAVYLHSRLRTLYDDHTKVMDDLRKDCREIAQKVFDHLDEKRTSIG